jgi:hypothetical protein
VSTGVKIIFNAIIQNSDRKNVERIWLLLKKRVSYGNQTVK